MGEASCGNILDFCQNTQFIVTVLFYSSLTIINFIQHRKLAAARREIYGGGGGGGAPISFRRRRRRRKLIGVAPVRRGAARITTCKAHH